MSIATTGSFSIMGRIIAAFERIFTGGDDLEWHSECVYRTVTLTDGSQGTRWLMRRSVKGQWEYRRMTAEEEAQMVSEQAW